MNSDRSLLAKQGISGQSLKTRKARWGMANIEIYTSPYCGYCHRAKQLLDRKGAAFTEIDVMADNTRRAEMMTRSNGGRTVPQIFIDGKHVGGCDDLYALDRAGGLDPLIAS